MPDDRRGVFGGAKPAFTVHRFKRVITINLNEEMAEEIHQILIRNEKMVQGETGQSVDKHLYEFNTQLQDAIDQKPPRPGEKPEMLAPGRPRKVS